MNNDRKYKTSVFLTDLIGKNVKGIIAQVRNPIYIDNDNPAMFRELISVLSHNEKGVDWVTVRWKPQQTDGNHDCGFSGCTIRSNTCVIQLTDIDHNKLFEQI